MKTTRTKPDLFHPPVYRTERVDTWNVLLCDGYPIAIGSIDTIRLHPCYVCVIR